jgi:translation elongation factor TU
MGRDGRAHPWQSRPGRIPEFRRPAERTGAVRHQRRTDGGQARRTVVTAIESFNKLLDQGEAGDNAGCLLRGISRDMLRRGQVLSRPGSVAARRRFAAEIYVLTGEEGGRRTPFFTRYTPQFFFRTADVTGTVELAAGVDMVMPQSCPATASS